MNSPPVFAAQFEECWRWRDQNELSADLGELGGD